MRERERERERERRERERERERFIKISYENILENKKFGK